jgi:hypothetical protein
VGVNDLQVGMVLLPDDLDMDLGYSALIAQSSDSIKRLAEGVGLWAKLKVLGSGPSFFTPLGNPPSIQVPFA